MKWATLVSRSTITQRESYPDRVLGNPTTKSVAISSHSHSGTCKGYNFLAGRWCLTLTLWQVSQRATYLATSLHSIPPIGCLEILVHLIPSWMHGISGLMSLSKYLMLQSLGIRHTNHSFVPQHPWSSSVNLGDFSSLLSRFIFLIFSSSSWPFRIS
jgi:hypothetical protein